MTGKELFRSLAHKTSEAVGSPAMFLVALFLVFVWLLTGPFFGFSTVWQLLINTGTTIATFLIVFLIQNTQNRDTRVIQLKLDELIHAVKTARNRLVDLEDLSDAELVELQREFERIQEHALLRLKKDKKRLTKRLN